MLDAFLNWFFDFMSAILVDGVWAGLKSFFQSVVAIFNFPLYVRNLGQQTFNGLEWVLAILFFILNYVIWFGLIFLIVLGLRKYLRFRKTLVGNEDLLEEIAELHRDVVRMTAERERLIGMKVSATGLPYADVVNAMSAGTDAAGLPAPGTEKAAADASAAGKGPRFFRLSAVDEKYMFYQPPVYDKSLSLSDLCVDIRNFACSRSHLFYEQKIIRLMIAGLASTKMILLQGISGTGKTSLPYMLGKYFQVDATIASVQPSWRDRTELFGYFNEFTKKFNETEVLRRIYESSYNDDINVIILDEMNIARVEYYFAEMLSILEMPDPAEWKIELVPSSWDSDPKHLESGVLQIPQNVWYIGTANNDDSTFAVSDKVYDRAFVINLDSKGIPFEAPDTDAKRINYSYVESLYKRAVVEHPVSEKNLSNISKLDLYVIEKFRVAFGNRILKQLCIFVPVFVACGGDEIEGIDYMLATKVFRKFESLNLSLIRDEIKGLILFMDSLFGKGKMKECTAFLLRLQKMY